MLIWSLFSTQCIQLCSFFYYSVIIWHKRFYVLFYIYGSNALYWSKFQVVLENTSTSIYYLDRDQNLSQLSKAVKQEAHVTALLNNCNPSIPSCSH